MDTWEILQDSSGRWFWRRINGIAVAMSDRVYDSRAECVADAEQNGYRDSGANFQNAGKSRQ